MFLEFFFPPKSTSYHPFQSSTTGVGGLQLVKTNEDAKQYSFDNYRNSGGSNSNNNNNNNNNNDNNNNYDNNDNNNNLYNDRRHVSLSVRPSRYRQNDSRLVDL